MSEPENAARQETRITFQTAAQNALIDMIEQLDEQGDPSPGMTALREASRFLGDTMFRMYEGTPMPSEHFKDAAALADHIFGYCAKEVGKTFEALQGKSTDMEIVGVHPTHETPQ